MKLTFSVTPLSLGEDLEESIRAVALESGVSRDEMLKRIVGNG